MAEKSAKPSLGKFRKNLQKSQKSAKFAISATLRGLREATRAAKVARSAKFARSATFAQICNICSHRRKISIAIDGRLRRRVSPKIVLRKIFWSNFDHFFFLFSPKNPKKSNFRPKKVIFGNNFRFPAKKWLKNRQNRQIGRAHV